MAGRTRTSVDEHGYPLPPLTLLASPGRQAQLRAPEVGHDRAPRREHDRVRRQELVLRALGHAQPRLGTDKTIQFSRAAELV